MNEPIAATATSGGRWMPSLHLGEARLARRAAEGDPRAFATIFERHGQEIYRFCLAILSNRDDAQDALQSTMANALRALPGERREISLRPWLFRVAHNEAITLVRQRRTALDPEAVVELVEPGADAEAADRERLRSLVSDLRSLPERQRSALVMQELNGMSHSEVAAALEISPGAARQAVYEARSALTEIGEGREMECDRVRQTISARDGRMLRGRKLRAHVRACDGCQDFLAGIGQRRVDLAMLFPPLPAAAAASILAGLTGGGAGGGAAAGGAGGAAAGSGASGLAGGGGLGALSAKGVAALVAAAVVGTGVAGYSGALDLPLPGKGSDDSSGSESGAAAEGSANGASAGHVGARGDSAGRGDAKGNAKHENRGNGGDGNGSRGTESNAGGSGSGNGAYSHTPGAGGTTPPGQGGTVPGQAITPSPPPQANDNAQGSNAAASGQSRAGEHTSRNPNDD